MGGAIRSAGPSSSTDIRSRAVVPARTAGRARTGRWTGTALLALLAGCAPPADERPPLQGVVLVLLDTVRADRLGCYGHERPTSPHLDALAAQGVRFEQAISSAPWISIARKLIAPVSTPFSCSRRSMQAVRTSIRSLTRMPG